MEDKLAQAPPPPAVARGVVCSAPTNHPGIKASNSGSILTIAVGTQAQRKTAYSALAAAMVDAVTVDCNTIMEVRIHDGDLDPDPDQDQDQDDKDEDDSNNENDNEGDKRPRHSCGGRRGRRRRYSCISEDVSIENVIQKLREVVAGGGVALANVEKITIEDIEDSIDIHQICCLLKSMPNLREVVLQNLDLTGYLDGSEAVDGADNTAGSKNELMSQHSRHTIEWQVVRLQACGQAENELLEWIITTTGLSVLELSLGQMLVKSSTIENIPERMPNLKRLRTHDIVPGRHQLLKSLKLHNRVALQELILQEPVYVNRRMGSLLGKLCNLQSLDLTLAFQSSSSAIAVSEFSQFLRKVPLLRTLSLRVLRCDLVGPSVSNASSLMECILESQITPDHLESLTLCFEQSELSDDLRQLLQNLMMASMDRFLERTINTTSLLRVRVVDRNSAPLLSLSPKAMLRLGLNRSGYRQQQQQIRRMLMVDEQDEGDRATPVAKGVEMMAGAKDLFPESEPLQVTVIYHILSDHPSWL